MSRLLSITGRAIAIAITAAVMLLPTPATAQSQDGEPNPYAKLDEKSRFAIQVLIDSAEAAGLPIAPLRSIALEGIARKIDGRKIVQVVRERLTLLRTARTVLGPVSGEELGAAAEVLKAGAKPSHLASFRQRQKGRSPLEAFVDWADLMSRGVASEDAASAITKLWMEGADDATFQSLQRNVQTDISLGLNPGAALQNRIRETPGRASPKISPPEGQQESDRPR